MVNVFVKHEWGEYGLFWVNGLGLILRLMLFASSGLFVASWETFWAVVVYKGEKEYLGLDECGLRTMSGELEES